MIDSVEDSVSSRDAHCTLSTHQTLQCREDCASCFSCLVNLFFFYKANGCLTSWILSDCVLMTEWDTAMGNESVVQKQKTVRVWMFGSQNSKKTEAKNGHIATRNNVNGNVNSYSIGSIWWTECDSVGLLGWEKYCVDAVGDLVTTNCWTWSFWKGYTSIYIYTYISLYLNTCADGEKRCQRVQLRKTCWGERRILIKHFEWKCGEHVEIERGVEVNRGDVWRCCHGRDARAATAATAKVNRRLPRLQVPKMLPRNKTKRVNEQNKWWEEWRFSNGREVAICSLNPRWHYSSGVTCSTKVESRHAGRHGVLSAS